MEELLYGQVDWLGLWTVDDDMAKWLGFVSGGCVFREVDVDLLCC